MFMRKICRIICALSIVLIMLFIFLNIMGCNADKTYSGAGTVSAFKLETTGSAATGTLAPNLMLGGAAYAGVGSPANENRPIFLHAVRKSIFTVIFGVDAGDSATIYIGTKNETAAETVARINAFQSIDTDTGK